MDVQEQLDRWVRAGVLDPGQAAAIAEFEAADASETVSAVADAPVGDSAPQRERRVSLVGEAVGYVGAALVVIAAGILIGEYWQEFRLVAKLGLVGTITAALIAVGWSLRVAREPAGTRLASFVWLLAVGTSGWLVGVWAGQDGAGLTVERTALAVTSAMFVTAVVLWSQRRSLLQHVATYVALNAWVIAVMFVPDGGTSPRWFALAIGGLAVIWLLLTEAGLLVPRAAGEVLGLAGVLIALQVMTAADEAFSGPGLIIALVVVAALLASAVVVRRPFPMWFGVAGLFLFVPQAVFHFFRDTVGAPIALLITGALLLATALGSARLRGEVSP